MCLTAIRMTVIKEITNAVNDAKEKSQASHTERIKARTVTVEIIT